MAGVTGPISTLPGCTSHSVPDGMNCDSCENPATVRIQGETDSFGCEMIDLCESCFEKEKEADKAQEDYETSCDWCKDRYLSSQLRPTRDYEEGSCGPVYYVCSPCRTKRDKAAQEELDEMYDLYDYDHGDDD